MLKLEDYMIQAHISKTGRPDPLLQQAGGFRYLLVRPKGYLRSLWIDACSLALTALPNAEDRFLLVMHTAFYHNLSKEFFSCVDADVLRQSLRDRDITITHVLTLIDDCYDMLARLSERGQVFHPLTEPGLSRLGATAEVVSKLLLILDWRAAEVTWADQLARQFKREHFLVAAKHPLSLVRDLLYSAKKAVYISHPITAVRELQRRNQVDEAKTIVDAIEVLTARLRRSEVLIPFSPTSIDELRIRREDRRLAPTLTERWPINDVTQLLFSPPAAPLATPLDPLPDADTDPGEETAEAFSVVLGLLVQRLLSHINWRDRKLVEQSQGLLAFRPYYTGRMSFGVLEEIRHRNTLEENSVIQEASIPCIVLSPRRDLALWKPEYIERKLRQETVLEDGSEPTPSLLASIRDRLRSNSEFVAAVEGGVLDGALLRRHVEQVATLQFRGTPQFGGPLDGVPNTLQEAWTVGKWQKLAEDVIQEDWIGKQLRSYDLHFRDEMSVDDFVARAEQVLGGV